MERKEEMQVRTAHRNVLTKEIECPSGIFYKRNPSQTTETRQEYAKECAMTKKPSVPSNQPYTNHREPKKTCGGVSQNKNINTVFY